ncbi:putative ribonuclease H-like domain-containing protein [Tanacetum coccineum]
MQEELLQFKLQKVWILVDLPKGHSQEEGIDYDEVFAPVARIEAIRMFLAYASYMGFMVYQMDVKSPFLYGQIEEEAYVCQPPGFEDPDHPDKVYKVVKALYGLHQELGMTLWPIIFCAMVFKEERLTKHYSSRDKRDILLVQIYVDDIIFGSTKKVLDLEAKKIQKALLKQQYENFSASSSESLDSIFNRLQKLVSRLAILGVVTPPEDLNVKFLKSLPSEYDTHVVVWMNKPDFDTMSLDDLYNNFKIVEQKVKKFAGAINDDKNLTFVTTSGCKQY